MLDDAACDGAGATLVEAPGPFATTSRLTLGDGMPLDTREAFGRPACTGYVAHWRLRDVTLLPALGLVFKDGEILAQTRYCVSPDELAAATQALARPHRRLDGARLFVGLNRVCANHYHIIAQLVPAIVGYQTEPGFRDGTLLLRAPGPVLLRALALAGVGPIKIVSVDGMSPLDAEDLTFSSLLTGSNGPSRLCLSTYDRMVENARPASAPTPRLIYVWRVDSQARIMRNEDALVAMLFRHGIEPVVPSTLSLDEQIALFANARMVVGPHGAGLANVAFATPGAVLYELLPDHYMNPCMNQLAQLRGVHYWADVHKAEARPGLWRHQTPWSVDIDAVERQLLEIMSVHDLR